MAPRPPTLDVDSIWDDVSDAIYRIHSLLETARERNYIRAFAYYSEWIREADRGECTRFEALQGMTKQK
jgi:hypothetical protein